MESFASVSSYFDIIFLIGKPKLVNKYFFFNLSYAWISFLDFVFLMYGTMDRCILLKLADFSATEMIVVPGFLYFMISLPFKHCVVIGIFFKRIFFVEYNVMIRSALNLSLLIFSIKSNILSVIHIFLKTRILTLNRDVLGVSKKKPPCLDYIVNQSVLNTHGCSLRLSLIVCEARLQRHMLSFGIVQQYAAHVLLKILY